LESDSHICVLFYGISIGLFNKGGVKRLWRYDKGYWFLRKLFAFTT